MGLDMYLDAKRFLWSEERKKIKTDLVPDGFEINGLKISVAYWRKANAIHRWFVENVQAGVDDCGEYPVSREQLMLLRDLAKHSLPNSRLAKKYLPTQGGFFFGGTDYDEYYFSVLKSTVEQIDKALKLSDDWEFYYRSSW